MRRRENEAADCAATEGVYMAATMAELGDSEPRINITRYDRMTGFEDATRRGRTRHRRNQ